MSYDDFLAAEHVHGANNTPDEIRRARVTVAGYALRHTGSHPDAVALARQLVDELGLNGRRPATSSHYRKNNPKWVGEL